MCGKNNGDFCRVCPEAVSGDIRIFVLRVHWIGEMLFVLLDRVLVAALLGAALR